MLYILYNIKNKHSHFSIKVKCEYGPKYICAEEKNKKINKSYKIVKKKDIQKAVSFISL